MANRWENARGIDIKCPLRFRFDGKPYPAFQGDTLASALLANGVKLVARSFKYHRPRGVYSDGSDEPNALVTVIREGHPEPNTRATEIEIFDGLEAWPQNAWPSLRFDFLAINNHLSRFLTAGFYYKTFMWPARFWESVYEPLIRRAAGLGRLSKKPDPSVYDKGYLHADFLVVGGGIAGLGSALKLADNGQQVVLMDERPDFGGQLRSEAEPSDFAWLESLIKRVEEHPGIHCMNRTTVFGSYDHGVYAAVSRNTEHVESLPGELPKQTLWTVSVGRTVIATGALTRGIAFPNNDRPGVMTMSALEAYALYFGSLQKQSIALFVTHDDGLRVARRLIAAGHHVTAVVDSRQAVDSVADLPHFVSSVVTNTAGVTGLKRIQIRAQSGSLRWVEADFLGVSGGFNPTVQLTCHQGAKPLWDNDTFGFHASKSLPRDQVVVGAADGHYDTLNCWQSAMSMVFKETGQLVDEIIPGVSRPLNLQPLYQVDAGGPAFVDLQNDVTSKDIVLSHQEGMISVEHLKRYTTLGMATDQGKHSNVLGLSVMAGLTGQTIAETGTTLARPPYTAVSIGALAGRFRGADFKPKRLTPTHHVATRLGARFVEVGNWLRAQWFPRTDDTGWQDTVNREVTTVRRAVGICDVTTLGKIDVQGSEAAKFLNFVYANGFLKLSVGKVRYGLMLREDGIAMDDGTAARFSENHFVVTTTTANAVAVYRHMEFVRQCLKPQLDVHLISTTEAWAQFAVAGPLSRDLIARVVDIDVSNQEFPFMACAEIQLKNGLRARLFRISFSGELAYEIAVPTRFGHDFFEYLLKIGEDLGVTPYGTEALGVLRIEKGHAAGAELNGQTTAANLGLGGMVSQTKDSIGRVLANREHFADDATRLVGLRPLVPGAKLVGGAHLVELGKELVAANDIGYVTSVAYSPHIGSMIALAYLQNADDLLGKRIRAVSLLDGLDVEVEVVSAHFVDPKGERVRA